MMIQDEYDAHAAQRMIAELLKGHGIGFDAPVGEVPPGGTVSRWRRRAGCLTGRDASTVTRNTVRCAVETAWPVTRRGARRMMWVPMCTRSCRSSRTPGLPTKSLPRRAFWRFWPVSSAYCRDASCVCKQRARRLQARALRLRVRPNW
jgi:hypothetical protein